MTESKLGENVKAFLFARWVSRNYDSKLMSECDGDWWRDLLKHFNDVVWKNYSEAGSIMNAEEFLKDLK